MQILQFPPPPQDVPPPNFFQFFMLVQVVFWGLALLLPRRWFTLLVRTAFPFLPKIEKIK